MALRQDLATLAMVGIQRLYHRGEHHSTVIALKQHERAEPRKLV